MLTQTNIKYLTDSWTSILFIENTPKVIFWNSRRQGGPYFSHIINDENNHNLENSENEEFKFENEVEIISAKSVKKTYEFYFGVNQTQRYYSNFARPFNQKNNEYLSIPNVDKVFYHHERLFDWKSSFLPIEANLDMEKISFFEKKISEGKRFSITLYQHYISQRGVYEDGSGWLSSFASPYYIINGNEFFQAYSNKKIKPDFILYTEKIRGNENKEFNINKNLLQEIIEKYLSEEQKTLIIKYR